MTHTTVDYVSRLHQQGYRITPQRQMILDAICESGGHSTPEEILQRVRARSSVVNAATVYRNLNFLVAVRLVIPCNLGGRNLAYEIAGETPHHHLICRKCGAISDLPHAQVEPLFSQIAKDQGFIVDTNHLVLFGLCSSCQHQEPKR